MNVAISRNLILNMRQERLSVCLSFWLAVSLVSVCLSVSPFLSFPFLSPSRAHSLYVVRCITSDPIELPSSVNE